MNISCKGGITPDEIMFILNKYIIEKQPKDLIIKELEAKGCEVEIDDLQDNLLINQIPHQN